MNADARSEACESKMLVCMGLDLEWRPRTEALGAQKACWLMRPLSRPASGLPGRHALRGSARAYP